MLALHSQHTSFWFGFGLSVSPGEHPFVSVLLTGETAVVHSAFWLLHMLGTGSFPVAAVAALSLAQDSTCSRLMYQRGEVQLFA